MLLVIYEITFHSFHQTQVGTHAGEKWERRTWDICNIQMLRTLIGRTFVVSCKPRLSRKNPTAWPSLPTLLSYFLVFFTARGHRYFQPLWRQIVFNQLTMARPKPAMCIWTFCHSCSFPNWADRCMEKPIKAQIQLKKYHQAQLKHLMR